MFGRATKANEGRSYGPALAYGAAAILALLGLADATYLTVQAFTGENLICGGSGECVRVLASKYARVGGIPVAVFGMLAYFSVFSCAVLAASGSVRARCAGISLARLLPLLPAFRGACFSTRFTRGVDSGPSLKSELHDENVIGQSFS